MTQTEYWIKLPGLIHSKEFIKNQSKSRTKQINKKKTIQAYEKLK